MAVAASARLRATAIDNPYWNAFVQVGDAPAADVRKNLISLYALAVTSPLALKLIGEFASGGLVEIGAGTGYWKFCLEQLGIEVAAYDLAPVNMADNRYFTRQTRCWAPVETGDADAVLRHSDRTLFLCWPPNDNQMAATALKLYTGRRLVYIGEASGTRTGNEQFRNRLGRHWRLERAIDIPRWAAHNDRLFLYRRV
jgi:hypothetical protein